MSQSTNNGRDPNVTPEHMADAGAITLFVIAGLIAVWDMLAHFFPAQLPTVSSVIIDWSTDHPVVPFLFGLLMGHLFWRTR